MVATLQFAAAHQMPLMVLGSMMAAVGVLVLVLMFPTNHQPSVLENSSAVGDGGLGYGVAVAQKWGFWRVMKFAFVPLLGITVASFALVAPAVLAAN